MHLRISTCTTLSEHNPYLLQQLLWRYRFSWTKGLCGFSTERQFPVWACGIPGNHLSCTWNSFGGHVKNRDKTAFGNTTFSILYYQPTISKLQGNKKLKREEFLSWNIWFSSALISPWKQIINISINIKRIIQSSLSSSLKYKFTVFWMQQQQTHFHKLKGCSQNSPRIKWNSRKTWP